MFPTCQLINKHTCNCLQVKKMLVMYESVHVAIALQLLEMSSITTPNQTMFAHGTFFKEFFLEKKISDFTDLHN